MNSTKNDRLSRSGDARNYSRAAASDANAMGKCVVRLFTIIPWRRDPCCIGCRKCDLLSGVPRPGAALLSQEATAGRVTRPKAKVPPRAFWAGQAALAMSPGARVERRQRRPPTPECISELGPRPLIEVQIR